MKSNFKNVDTNTTSINNNYCKYCGEKLVGNPKKCQKCDKLIETKSNISIILLLIFFFPLGIYWMWKKSNWKKPIKITLTILYSLYLAFWILVAVTPTDNENNDDLTTAITIESTSETTTESTTKKSQNILMNSELIEAPVMNGTRTEQIGTYAYIKLSSSDFNSLKPEDYYEFAVSKVDKSGYNWVSIISDNGQGATWSGSIISVLTFGELDNEGCITKQEAVWELSNNTYSLIWDETSDETNTETTKKETTSKKNKITTTEEYKETYIVNKSTGKFHSPNCYMVDKIKSGNKKEIQASYDQMKNKGYSPCKKCLG